MKMKSNIITHLHIVPNSMTFDLSWNRRRYLEIYSIYWKSVVTNVLQNIFICSSE